jgi:hypothetical protein
MIETIALFLFVLFSFGFIYLVNRNLITLLGIVMFLIFLIIIDYSQPFSPYLGLFIVIAMILLAVKFYSSMRD